MRLHLLKRAFQIIRLQSLTRFVGYIGLFNLRSGVPFLRKKKGRLIAG